jgi:hypothetical protein
MTSVDFIQMVKKFEENKKLGISEPIPINSFGLANTEWAKQKTHEEVKENAKQREFLT